jgi:hypothetical protein
VGEVKNLVEDELGGGEKAAEGHGHDEAGRRDDVARGADALDSRRVVVMAWQARTAGKGQKCAQPRARRSRAPSGVGGSRGGYLRGGTRRPGQRGTRRSRGPAPR